MRMGPEPKHHAPSSCRCRCRSCSRLVLLVVGGVDNRAFRRRTRRRRCPPSYRRAGAISQAVDLLRRTGGAMVLSGKPMLLGPAHRCRRPACPPAELVLHVHQLWSLDKEPAVDLGERRRSHRRMMPRLQGLVHHEDAARRRMSRAVASISSSLCSTSLGRLQGIHAQLHGAHRLHQRLLKGVADGHDLAGGLHLGAQGAAGVDELVKGPAGELDHHSSPPPAQSRRRSCR